MRTLKRGLGVLSLLALLLAAAGCGGAQPAPYEAGGGGQPSAPQTDASARDLGPSVVTDPALPGDHPVSDRPVSDLPKKVDPPPAARVDQVPPPDQGGGAMPANPNPPANKNQPASQVSFTTLQRGAYAGITRQMAVLITSEAEWQRHWQQHAANLAPVPAAPKVDFATWSLLAIYMGEKGSGGYGLEVQSIQEENGMLTVRVRQSAPGPGDMVTTALTQPFQVLQIPKVAPDTKLNVIWQ